MRTVSEITSEGITLLIHNLEHDNNTFDKSDMSHVKSIEKTVKAHEVTIKNLDTKYTLLENNSVISSLAK